MRPGNRMFERARSVDQQLNTKTRKNTMKARRLKGKLSPLPEGTGKATRGGDILSQLKRKLLDRLCTGGSFQLLLIVQCSCLSGSCSCFTHTEQRQVFLFLALCPFCHNKNNKYMLVNMNVSSVNCLSVQQDCG